MVFIKFKAELSDYPQPSALQQEMARPATELHLFVLADIMLLDIQTRVISCG